jgi:hypothetical protein
MASFNSHVRIMKYEMLYDSMPTWNSPPKAKNFYFEIKHENKLKKKGVGID